MTIKTLHGQFTFYQQRLVDRVGQTEFTYLQQTDPCQSGYESERLREQVCYQANRTSYHEVARGLKRSTGVELLSPTRIQEIVIAKAQQLSDQQVVQTLALLESNPTLPALNEQLDLYEAQSQEILLLCDGIGVKRQKFQRSGSCSQEAVEAEPKQVVTDVVMLQQPEGDFQYLMAGLPNKAGLALSLEQVIQAAVLKSYGQASQPLNLIAITDGARNIRCLFEALFGLTLIIILDWYHLRKRCRELMSMIARTKAEKEEHLQIILAHLWRGEIQFVLTYLQTQLVARHPDKLAELITYLTKHSSEIIDYGKRQTIGKPIGSGRMEKAVDQTIGYRQKGKGMSWSQAGSRALGFLKTFELNGQWEHCWAF